MVRLKRLTVLTCFRRTFFSQHFALLQKNYEQNVDPNMKMYSDKPQDRKKTFALIMFIFIRVIDHCYAVYV